MVTNCKYLNCIRCGLAHGMATCFCNVCYGKITIYEGNKYDVTSHVFPYPKCDIMKHMCQNVTATILFNKVISRIVLVDLESKPLTFLKPALSTFHDGSVFRTVSSNKLGCLHTQCLKVDNDSD